METESAHPIIHQLQDKILDAAEVSLSVLRLDLINPTVSGNKWYKLKYNLQQAHSEGLNTLLTFGGAFSNHIHATAAAGKQYEFKTIGVIRGEQSEPLNPTLKFAASQGMQLHFISREAYRQKTKIQFIEKLHQQFGPFYLIPEGGTNLLAVRGCSEILPRELEFDVISCCVGTGGTIAGLLVSLAGQKQLLSFPALKGGDFLRSDIDALTKNYHGRIYSNYRLITDYHFGGYARANSDLVNFINEFYRKHQMLLDPIYNGKLFYGLFDLVERGYFPPRTQLLAIHSGGLQGIAGFNQRYKNKNLCILED